MSDLEIPDIRCPCCGGGLEVDIDYVMQQVDIDCTVCRISWDRWGENPKRWAAPR